MVCFAQFVYNVKFDDLPTFLMNAKRYFKRVTWKITNGDVTIVSADVDEAVNRLNPQSGCIVKFDTQRIWDQCSFVNTVPQINWDNITVSDENRTRHAKLAERLANSYHDSGNEIAMFCPIEFPWECVSCVMKLVHEITPLHGYLYCPSVKSIILKKQGSNHLMEICKNSRPSYHNGPQSPDTYTNCVSHLLFDFDDGFIGPDNIPVELTNAFERWKNNGCVGPVLVQE